MKRYRYYFILVIISLGLFQYFYLHKKDVKLMIWKKNGKQEVVEFSLPKYANLHLYKNKIQYIDKSNYYQTIYYNAIEFKEIK